ncbi:formylglycine-generating enzyme family protein [Candidatus Venteria ishoeyi]|uniref:Serine/threonine-protein kinase pkn1 n=1 Tax=Candidatus Venteria ishoeyi TaxID=1899563 RepID=A0A1H6F8S8_9GAMM|nr:formylglycine-generating enzyme family protein [Candidatus Venteria ishoeyi]SEH05993.1 Serine/threonine-protein kinase pkn1 [Candidatus Venteria ishoeyi]
MEKAKLAGVTLDKADLRYSNLCHSQFQQAVLTDTRLDFAFTFAQYDAFCLATRRKCPDDQGWGREQRPVINVRHEDAKAYCAWLTAQTGQSYTLPSEAQWGYACRAGSDMAYCFGDDEQQLKDYAWYADNTDRQTHPVGEKQPNAWGLYDMHGNVWEWCMDRYVGFRLIYATFLAVSSGNATGRKNDSGYK